jgi:hypothetical protein
VWSPGRKTERLNGRQRIGIVLSVSDSSGLQDSFGCGPCETQPTFTAGCYGRASDILDVDNNALQYIEKPEESDKRLNDNCAKYERCQNETKVSQQYSQQYILQQYLVHIDEPRASIAITSRTGIPARVT